MQIKPTTEELAQAEALVDSFYQEYLSKTLLNDPLTKSEATLLKTFALYINKAKKNTLLPGGQQ